MKPGSAPLELPVRGLRDHVHAKLRRAIVSGELASGVWLNERQLAESLGVSTTPIKEALRRLEGEGLVETEPRRGICVTFTPRRAEEIGYARAALESMTARLATERITAEEKNHLREAVHQMGLATRVGHVDALMALNESFHEQIGLAARCAHITALLAGQRIYDTTARINNLGYAEERERGLAEHTAIFEAIVAGDADAAESAMREHIMRSTRRYIATAFASEDIAIDPS